MAARRGAGFQRRYLHSGRIRGRCYTVTGRCNSSHRLLELGEKGVYPSYTTGGGEICVSVVIRINFTDPAIN